LRKERKEKEKKGTNLTGRTAILCLVPSCEDIVFLFFLLENLRVVPKKRYPSRIISNFNLLAFTRNDPM
tara:strand:- start:483 stop:689 length:207 start_codon:yes stop_codon:yes gene_type:complete